VLLDVRGRVAILLLSPKWQALVLPERPLRRGVLTTVVLWMVVQVLPMQLTRKSMGRVMPVVQVTGLHNGSLSIDCQFACIRQSWWLCLAELEPTA
jgi:hypothetical protein